MLPMFTKLIFNISRPEIYNKSQVVLIHNLIKIFSGIKLNTLWQLTLAASEYGLIWFGSLVVPLYLISPLCLCLFLKTKWHTHYK